MTTAVSETAAATSEVVAAGQRRSLTHSMRKFCREQPLAVVCAVIIVLLLILAAVGPSIAPYSYDRLDIPHRLRGPSAAHWFGTDQQGRDVFSRVLFGARTTVVV